MNAFAILLPVIFPIIAGACLLPVKFSDRKARQRVVLPIIVLNAIFALYAIFFADSGAITISASATDCLWHCMWMAYPRFSVRWYLCFGFPQRFMPLNT